MDLSTELSVSRQTVGIALVRLAQDGLVLNLPNRGASVRSVTVSEALSILRIREALEGTAASMASESATDGELAELREIVEKMESEEDLAGLKLFTELNARFHGLIIQAARNETLERLLASLNYSLVRYQYRTILVPGRRVLSLREHRLILHALEARDPEAAETAARSHVSRVRQTLAASADMLSRA